MTTIDKFVNVDELNTSEQIDAGVSPGEIYVSMLERKVIECGTENESLHKVNKKLMHMIKKVEEQLEGTDAMTRLRIAWAIASNFPNPQNEEEFDYWGDLEK